MRKRLSIMILAILIVAFAAPTAFAGTFYNTMGHNLHYDDWGNPVGGTTLKFDVTGEPIGFSVYNDGPGEAGGELGYAIMEPGMTALDMNFSAQIDYSGLNLIEGHFGLEMGWNLAGEPLHSQTGGNNAGVGIYAAAYHNPLDPSQSIQGYVNAAFNEQTGIGGPIPGGAIAPGILWDGSLKIEKMGTMLTTSFAGVDMVFHVLDVIDLTTLGLAGDFLTVSFGAGTAEFGAADVTFAGFTASPGPPAATPIPGAVWLLGSGLAGLVGLRRKYRK